MDPFDDFVEGCKPFKIKPVSTDTSILENVIIRFVRQKSCMFHGTTYHVTNSHCIKIKVSWNCVLQVLQTAK